MSRHAAETAWMRARISELLEEQGFARVVDHFDEGGTWTGEFHRDPEDPDEGIALWVIKPAAAPYASVGLVVPLAPAGDLAELEERLEIVSDHDLAFAPAQGDRNAQLSLRVLASGLAREDLDLHLANLLACRESLLDREDEAVRAEAARQIELLPLDDEDALA
ncbi:MAG: hypothetical protein R3F20_03470 [Planctomycetota bacterium]